MMFCIFQDERKNAAKFKQDSTFRLNVYDFCLCHKSLCMKKATITRSNNRKKANRKRIERWKNKNDFIAVGSPVPKSFRPIDETKKQYNKFIFYPKLRYLHSVYDKDPNPIANNNTIFMFTLQIVKKNKNKNLIVLKLKSNCYSLPFSHLNIFI